jgi:hypothetical protein
VFVTGDFSNKRDSGFQGFEEFCAALTDKLGYEPALFAAPGNHDMQRDENLADVLQKYEPKVLWEKSHLFVSLHFEAYSTWWNEHVERLKKQNISITPGLAPGDFSATFTKTAPDSKLTIHLGIFGFNSAFLHHKNNCKGSFHLYSSFW